METKIISEGWHTIKELNSSSENQVTYIKEGNFRYLGIKDGKPVFTGFFNPKYRGQFTIRSGLEFWNDHDDYFSIRGIDFMLIQ